MKHRLRLTALALTAAALLGACGDDDGGTVRDIGGDGSSVSGSGSGSGSGSTPESGSGSGQ